MRVQIVDPSAYTPPYDHALCSALARQGADVELITSHFAYGPVAPADGYVRREIFYRAVLGAPGSRVRMASKLAEHVPDMLRYRRVAHGAQMVHFQWLTVQHLDRYLLPSRPLVLTAHDVLPREPRPGQLRAQRRLYDRFDAIVVHSEHGRARLVEELGVEAERIHVIPHGAFMHLAEQPAPQPAHEQPAEQPPADQSGAQPVPGRSTMQPAGGPPFDTEEPVVLCFGLIRPYKGVDVLLRAWRELGAEVPGELWIAGMPKMDVSALRAMAPAGVRWDMCFIGDDLLPAYFKRADLVVLPYLQADQSGVLFTALAFGKPLLLSDVGGFPEMASTGAARIVPAGDAKALAGALSELLADRQELARMGERARAAAQGRYSWDSIAQAHLKLYESLL